MGILDAPGISKSTADARYAQQNDLPGVNAVRAGIDNTGTTNVSTALYNLLYLTGNVYLPPGNYLVTGSDGFKPPNNCRMSGIKPTYTMDGFGGGAFSGGSVLIGSGPSVLNVGNRTGLSFSSFGVNATNGAGNAIQGLGNATSDLHFDKIVTHAANHNYLFEQYGNDPQGSLGGGITISNFELHGGPNGIAIKCRDVLVQNGIAHDISVQAYVAVSDNIEGTNIYNRAQNVTFRNCRLGLRCAGSGGRVYSRDCWSITNANGVQPALNIRFLDGAYSGASAYGIMIGDEVALETTPLPGSAAAGQTRIPSQEILIDVAALGNGRNGIRVATGNDVLIRGSVGGNGTAGVVNGTTYANVNISADTTGVLQQGGASVTGMRVSADLSVFGTAVGMETQVAVIPFGVQTVNVGSGAQVFQTANVTTNILNAVSNAKAGQEFVVWINDTFSQVQLAPNTPVYVGKGTMVRYRCVDSAGTIIHISGNTAASPLETPRSYTSAFNMNAAIGGQAAYCTMTGDIASVGLFPPSVTAGRDGWSLRFIAGASTRAITAWSSSFKWPVAQFPSGAPSSVAANTTLLITFFWDGTSMIAKGSWIY